MTRHTCSLITVAVLAVAVSAGARTQERQQAIRFAAMDRNRDGVVTRAEWRGSDRSFRVHDWNSDGVLSGDELRPGVQRPAQAGEDVFDSSEREYTLHNWTARQFAALDHNQDGRLTRDEWHFDRESFRRADHDRDGVLTRDEFLGTDGVDDDRSDKFEYLDANDDGRVSRAEWHGDSRRFDMLDDNGDGVLTRAEAFGTAAPAELFASLDVNRDRAITPDEWHWATSAFNERDSNGDGRLSREEFTGVAATTGQNAARKAGYERGLIEGRTAGREDRQRNQGWDLEGQRELETADSGYEASMGSRTDYQAGYREGFRRGYREGWNQK